MAETQIVKFEYSKWTRAGHNALLGAVFFCGAAMAPAQEAPATKPSLGEMFGEEPAATPAKTPASTPASLSEMFTVDDAATTGAMIQAAQSTPAAHADSIIDAGDEDSVIKIVFHDDVVQGTPSNLSPEITSAPHSTQTDLTTEDTARVEISEEVAGEDESQLYAEAIQHLAAGHRKEAEASLRLLVDQYPFSPLTPPALFELIRVLESPLDKLKWCNHFITNYPDSGWTARVYLLKGHILAGMGEVAEATTAFEWAGQELGDENLRLEAVRMHLQMLVLAGRFDNTLRAYDESPVPSLTSKDPIALYWVLKAQLGLQRWEEALKLSGRLIAIDVEHPYRAEVMLARGTLLEHAGQLSEARSVYNQLAQRYPQNAAAEFVKSRLGIWDQPMWPVPAGAVSPSAVQ